MNKATLPDNKPLHTLFYWLLGSLSVALFIKNAWAAEDSFILLRSVDQFLHGNGFRWNPHERVEVYTSPLWFLLVVANTFLCKDLYLNIISLSLVLHVALLAVMAKLFVNVWRWIAAVVLLSLSQAFFDFTASGLEYPLAYFLLATFLLLYLREQHLHDRYWLAISSGLALITRHDLLFILLLPLLHLAWYFLKTLSLRQQLSLLAVFLTPLVCWTTFSILYYGFPFPNTAYAKLSVSGLAQSERFMRGFNYVYTSLQMDPITLIAIFLGIYKGITESKTVLRIMAATLLLAFVYVYVIGGDYMIGRFYAVPYLAAVLYLCSTNWPNEFFRHPAWRILLGITLVGLLFDVFSYELDLFIRFFMLNNRLSAPEGFAVLVGICIALTAGSFFHKKIAAALNALVLLALFYTTQIHDGPWQTGYGNWGKTRDFDSWVALNTLSRERYWIYRWTSIDAWLHRDLNRKFPDHDWCYQGVDAPRVSLTWGAGMQPYCMPIDYITVDRAGLGDPMLARMPMYPTSTWMSGGALRIIPDGYMETLASGKNLLTDPDLAIYYDKLGILTRADQLFSWERIKTIVLFNVGAYDYLMQSYTERMLKNPPKPPEGV